jgi:hypothetical protein
MTDAERVERLLQLALTPVEPPEALSDRLERGLSELTDAAVEELAEWELSAMSDPRNWVRPAAALAVGTAAGTALVVLGMRRSRRRRPGLRGIAVQGGRSVGDAVSSARSLIR